MINFSNPQKLRAGLIAILVGLFLAQFCGEAKYFLFFGGAFLAISILGKEWWFAILAIFFLSVFYGQLRNYVAFGDNVLGKFENELTSISGEVTSFLDEREKNNRVFLRIFSVDGEEVDGKVLFVFPKDLAIKYGDKISFWGKIEQPRNFQDFDYSAYLRRFGATAIVRGAQEVTILSHDGGNWFLRAASSARDFFTRNLEKSLPIPHDRIATGILLGVKNALPTSVSEDFKRSGLTHLLVVSGFNVSVVVLLVAMIFKSAGRRFVFLASVVAIVFFGAITGGDAPVVRAAIMGSLTGWAAATGRLNDAKNIVLCSAVLIGIFAPAVIQRDIGFFLSFSATVGIILFSKFFEKLFSFLPKRFEIRQIVAVLTAAQISVFPILGFYFGNFPLIGFVSNLFAEPIVPLSMAFSTAAIFGGVLPTLFAKIITIPAFITLEILITIAHVFGQVPPIPVSKEVAIFLQVIVVGAFLYGFFAQETREQIKERD